MLKPTRFPYALSPSKWVIVATLAFNSQLRKGLAKVWAKREA
jgi:hypothetical protein